MTEESPGRVNMRLKPDKHLHSSIVAYQLHVLHRQKREINLDEAAYELIRLGLDTVPEVKEFLAA